MKTHRSTARRHRHISSIEPLEARIAPATFTVTNPANAGGGSLRQAILDANSTANSTGADLIQFFGSAGAFIITLSSPLPDITEAVMIDGYSHSFASPNMLNVGTNAVIAVGIDGSLLSSGNGLVLGGSGGSTVKGLAIFGFSVGVNGMNDNGNAILIQSSNNVVGGNFLGTGIDGGVTPATKNANSGVSIGNLSATATYSNNIIGGTLAADKNLIAGNGVGISLDTDAAGTTIQRNLIGTNKAGTVAQPNDIAGIKVGQATATLIGGVAAGAGNVISGNTGPGIELSAGSGTTIQKNFIGTNAQGSSALPNMRGGVNAHDGVTGGAILGNTIAGNSLFGIALGGVGGSASGMNIKGNFIGTNSGGAQLANTGDAISIGFSSSGNTIGGTAGGDGNTIAFNDGAGVEILDGQGNSILGNSIHDNKGLGIHLQGGGGVFGVLQNDAGDSDMGANGKQNHPLLQTFNNTGSAITLDGQFTSAPNTTYRIEFFGMAPTQIDDSGYGEGTVFLGSLSVTTDNTGFTPLNFNTNISLPADTAFSATATNMTTGDTSEFGPTIGTSTTYTWTGSQSGDWANAQNWTPSGVPGPLDSVIYNGGTSEVNFTNPHSVKSFTQNGGSLTGGAALVILQMMDWNGGTHNGPNLLLETNAIATFSGTSALVWNGGNLVNDSLLTVGGQGLDFKNGTISNPGNILLEAGITDSDGATTPTALNNFGSIIKNGTGSFGISGVPITGSGNLTSQQGVFTLEALTVSGVFASVAMNGGDFTFGGTGLLLKGNSLLFGAGTITGDVTNDGGLVAPGAGSTGTMQIAGDYTQTANGTLTIEVGGASAGQFDKLAVSGFTTLDGTLTAMTINGFTPTSGASFTFLTGVPVAGTFATVNGGGFAAQYTGSTASLVAATLTDMDVSFTAGSLFLTDTPGSTSAANLTISLNGVNLRINDPTHTLTAKAGVSQIDANTVEVLFSNITGLVSIDGVSGDDRLTVDYSSGSPVPTQGITFNGGAGQNTLTVSGVTATTVEHRLTGAGAGAIKVDADTIIYSNTMIVGDLITATDRIFTGSSAAENITITNGLTGSTTFSSSQGATIKFPDQSASLSIFGGNGDDTITINASSYTFAGTLVLDGGAGTDTISFPAIFTTAGLTAISENLNPLAQLRVGSLGADITTPAGISFQNTGGLKFDLATSSGGGPPILGALSVHGALDLTDASLSVSSSFTGLITAPLLLISNDGTDAITGTFDNLAEGSTLPLSGKVFTLSYLGGDGNDVTLTPLLVVPPGTFKLGDLNGTNGFKIPGKISGDRAGGSVRSAGDVNGDGFSDFILGAEHALIGSSTEAGASYVIFGKSAAFPKDFDLDTLDGTTGFKIEGEAAGDLSSTSVSGGGDINGDGFADLIVGAAYADTNGHADSGATYVIFGKASGFTPTLSLTTLNGTNGFRINGVSTLEYSGSRVSTAGDMNGDGFADILIAQPFIQAGTTGSVFVVFGKKTAFTATLDLTALNGANGFRINGANNNDYFGHSISTAGDVNGDGFSDILLSAPGADEGGSNRGAAYVVFGKSTAFTATLSISTLDGKIGFKIPGTTNGDQLGNSVSSAGDINGDGLDDLLIGTNSDGGASAGYIIFGKRKGHTASFSTSTLNGTNGFQITSDFAGAKIVSSAGDFNGDGLSDFLISSPDTSDGGDSYLAFGRASGFAPTLNLATLNGTTGYHFIAEAAGNHSGLSLSSAGDINKDGFGDFLIGAPTALANAGTTYIVLGKGTQHALPTSKSGGTAITFTDTDGDIINVTTSKGKLTADMFTFGPSGGLFMVDLNANGPFKSGADLTFAVKKAGGGNGVINVGAIMSTDIQLGNVKITGDLGQIDVGTGALTKSGSMKPALKSLTVGSLGMMGEAMQTPGTVDPLTSDINGALPKLTVKGNIHNATLKVAGALGKATITGDFTGLGALSFSQLQGLAALGHGIVAPLDGGITLTNSGLSAGSIGALAVKGSIHNAAVNSNGTIGSVNVAHDVNGGAIVAAGALKVVKVFGNITSDDPNAPSVIAALASVPNSKPKSAIAINTLTVKGNVQNAEILLGYNKSFAATNSDASAGNITVKGTWTAASLAVGIADKDHDGFGQNDLPIFAGVDGTGTDATPTIISRIASITIGSITNLADGTAAAGDYYGITAQSIGKAKINGIKLALDKNAKDDIALGTHGDFRLVEV